MNHEVHEAIREWENEVDAETVKLIRSGTPPYEAIERAKKIVTRRREERGPAATEGKEASK